MSQNEPPPAIQNHALTAGGRLFYEPMNRIYWLGFAIVLGICLASEYGGRRQVNPTGRVSNLQEFLSWRPAASEFSLVDSTGKPHLIAYGPISSWLASGPSAYVFDEAGVLVDWSADIGDDSHFDAKWNAQRARRAGRTMSRAEVRQR